MTNNKIILGLVGPIASGKGAFCQYFKSRHQAEILRFSTVLRDVLDRFYIEQSRENMQALSSALRQIFGDDLLAKTMADDVAKSPAKIIVLDGIRRLPDIKYLKESPNFHLVEITADQQVRFERIISRKENTDDAKKTFAEFQNDEKQEAELQIKEVAQAAKFHILNNGTIENLHDQIDIILKKLGAS